MNAPTPQPPAHTPEPWTIGTHPGAHWGTDWVEIVGNSGPYAPHLVALCLRKDAPLIASAPALAAENAALRSQRDELAAALALCAQWVDGYVRLSAGSGGRYAVATSSARVDAAIARAALAKLEGGAS